VLQIAQAVSPGHWASVKVALIRSIRGGVFFDRKYWARHSKAGEVLKPIYLSSVIMSDKAQQLKKSASKPCYGFAEVLRIPVVKYLKGENPFKTDPEEDITIESDCEGELLGAEDGLLDTKGEEEEQTRAVLVNGSFAAYVHSHSALVTMRNTGYQLEIFILLSLHGRDIIRSPQIARYRLPPEVHSRKHGGGCTPSLLSEEYLRFGKPGGMKFTTTSHTRLTHGY
jgi:hypothetical protein